MFSTEEDVQYWEDVQCGGGCSVLCRCSVLWRMLSTRKIFSTVEDVQYCGGCSVLWRMFSTDEDVQC